MNTIAKSIVVTAAMFVGANSYANIHSLDSQFDNCRKQLNKEHGFKSGPGRYWTTRSETQGRYTVHINGKRWQDGSPLRSRGTCEITHSGQVLAMQVEPGVFVDKRRRR